MSAASPAVGAAPAAVATAPARLDARGVGRRVGDAVLLADVDVDVPAGRWLAVVGPNGAGKSTLLRLLAGVARGQGSIRVDGVDLGRLAARARARLVAYAPQSPTFPPGMAVGEYVMLGRTPHRGLLAGPGGADRAAVADALARMGLDAMRHRPLGELSGGERQRAAFARVLAQRPRVLVLDEPTSSLDLGQAQQALELVDHLRRQDGTAVVTALHDLTLAAQYADRLLLLAGGRAVACGRPESVLTAPVLARHYGAVVDVTPGPDGVRIHPRRPAR